MTSYNARLEPKKDIRFSEFPITLKTSIPVHRGTKLSWIEPMDEDADEKERLWYAQVLEHNML